MRQPTDHAKLIYDMSELQGLFADTSSLESFLQKIVNLIADHMHSHVCSIYLYYEDREELVLSATRGLQPQAVGRVRLKLGEGLTGLALKELRPICEKQASGNPHFRYFSDIGEEPFESFLVVPIVRGTKRIGAMVVQNTQKNFFTPEDMKVLQAITSQLANTIETTKLLMTLQDRRPAAAKAVVCQSQFIKGRVGSEGLARAPGVVLRKGQYRQPLLEKEFSKKYSLAEFQQAVAQTEKELKNFERDVEERLADVASLIFTAQILMLKDNDFMQEIERRISSGSNPPNAITAVVKEFVTRFSQFEDAYLREKSQDVEDVGRRLLENLVGNLEPGYDVENRIIVAEELLPTDILKLSSEGIKGLILLSGGASSHLSILAGSLQLPLVIAECPDLLDLKADTPLILDADVGNIYVDPSPEVLAQFKEREEGLKTLEELQREVRDVTFTKDGTRIRLQANINLLGDLKTALALKAEGIGLYRTEFPFIVRSDFPTEEEQFVIYRKLVQAMGTQEITFRTLDIGGDKVLSYYHVEKEENPFLGMRSIRFCLRHKDIFAQQIRAILRAGAEANLRIMFPMISSLDEFLEAKDLVKECLESLSLEGVAHHPRPALGIMIEMPSVLEILDELAEAADFFSIGTNDFIQYMLAVDRTNEKVADFYLPYHPSVLRALKRVVAAAQKHSKDVSVCGDMADKEEYLPYFLGIGVRKLSLNPRHLPKIQKAIAALELRQAERQMWDLLRKNRIVQIQEMLFDPLPADHPGRKPAV